MDRKRHDGHTILFLQVTDDVSRTYSDYKDTDAAFYGMCEMFEETYKRKAHVDEVTYDISDVIEYFKSFTEILLMVFDDDIGHYVPRDGPWIMQKLEEYGKDTTPDTASKSAATAQSEDVDFEEDEE